MAQEVCISRAACKSRISTFYKYKAKYGGMDVSDARKVKALKDENAKLKKLVAEAMLDYAMLKDVAAKYGDPRCEAECGGSRLCAVRGDPTSGVRGSIGGSVEHAISQCAA